MRPHRAPAPALIPPRPQPRHSHRHVHTHGILTARFARSARLFLGVRVLSSGEWECVYHAAPAVQPRHQDAHGGTHTAATTHPEHGRRRTWRPWRTWRWEEVWLLVAVLAVKEVWSLMAVVAVTGGV